MKTSKHPPFQKQHTERLRVVHREPLFVVAEKRVNRFDLVAPAGGGSAFGGEGAHLIGQLFQFVTRITGIIKRLAAVKTQINKIRGDRPLPGLFRRIRKAQAGAVVLEDPVNIVAEPADVGEFEHVPEFRERLGPLEQGTKIRQSLVVFLNPDGNCHKKAGDLWFENFHAPGHRPERSARIF